MKGVLVLLQTILQSPLGFKARSLQRQALNAVQEKAWKSRRRFSRSWWK